MRNACWPSRSRLCASAVALALVGAIDWLQAALLAITQIVAGIAAAGVVSALFPGDLGVRTTLNSNTSVVRGLFIEMFLTAELIFCIFMLAAEKHKATFLAPLGIGLALFIAELAGENHTGSKFLMICRYTDIMQASGSPEVHSTRLAPSGPTLFSEPSMLTTGSTGLGP